MLGSTKIQKKNTEITRFNLDKKPVVLLQAEGQSENTFSEQYPSSHSPQLLVTSVYFHFLLAEFWNSPFVSFHYLRYISHDLQRRKTSLPNLDLGQIYLNTFYHNFLICRMRMTVRVPPLQDTRITLVKAHKAFKIVPEM